jgi:predicted homoserine dehydrogenase-like protein
MSVARAVLFNDAVMTPQAGPRVEVITAAKIDLKQGQTIDGLGGYMTYGLAENASTLQEEDLLPIGLAEGCRLNRDIKKDEVLTRKDVTLPEGRLVDRLRAEQDAFFGRNNTASASTRARQKDAVPVSQH